MKGTINNYKCHLGKTTLAVFLCLLLRDVISSLQAALHSAEYHVGFFDTL